MILFNDTETTDKPAWATPSDSPDQPHIVQLAMVAGQGPDHVGAVHNFLIRPEGWTWDETSEAFKVHGITMERASDEGVAEAEAIEELLALTRTCQRRAAYNVRFDDRIIRCAIMRYHGRARADQWRSEAQSICVMQLASDHHCLPGHRTQKLVTIYQHFFGVELIGAHDALVDTMAARRVFHEIERRRAVAGAAPIYQPCPLGDQDVSVRAAPAVHPAAGP